MAQGENAKKAAMFAIPLLVSVAENLFRWGKKKGTEKKNFVKDMLKTILVLGGSLAASNNPKWEKTINSAIDNASEELFPPAANPPEEVPPVGDPTARRFATYEEAIAAQGVNYPGYPVMYFPTILYYRATANYGIWPVIPAPADTVPVTGPFVTVTTESLPPGHGFGVGAKA